MPKRSTPHIAGTRKYLHNCSFELLCAHWFVRTGWQVFTPLFDHGHHTDLLVSDGPKYFRIQVKTVEAGSDDLVVDNKWSGSNVHYVAVFAKNSSWGINQAGVVHQGIPPARIRPEGLSKPRERGKEASKDGG